MNHDHIDQPHSARTYEIRLRNLGASLVAAAITLVGGNASNAQTLLFDFGAAGNQTQHGVAGGDPVNYWNNLTDTIGTSVTGVLTNIVTADNAPTTVGLAIVSRFSGANGNGTVDPSPFPTEATRDSLYGHTELWNGVTDIFPRFKLTGLSPATVYNFTIYASRTGAADNRETGFGFTGAASNYVTFNAANNVAGTTNLDGITPDANGEILISLSPGANNNNAYHFTYLGVLKVDSIPPQTPIGFTQQPTNARVVAFAPATFQAAVTGSPPYFIQWLSNEVAIAGANQLTYTIPSTTIDMNGSQFRVSVSNLAYSALSTNATLRVITDTNPPVLLSATSMDGLTILLAFNELLESSTASDYFSYNVNDGAVTISNPVLQPDGKSVVITLSSPITGAFKVVVNFVQDLSGNVIAIDSTVFGEVPNPELQPMLFDFGGANTTGQGAPPDDPTNYWNNITTTIGASDTGELTNIVTAANVPTTTGLAMIRRFNGVNENGTQASTLFPADATRDSLYGNTEVWGGLTDIFPSFKLTGLNPALVYKLTVYASRTGVSDNRETGFAIEGAQSNYITFNAANNINGNHFTYLGVLKVEPSKPPPHFLPLKIATGQVELRWTGTGFLEWAPTVVGPWTRYAPQPSSPYSEAFVPTENRFYRLNLNP